MPSQNRVTPFGKIVAISAKGSMMGNRGCLHSAEGDITKQWVRKAWVTCLLKYNNRHRQVMAPGQYTELFFLDEATALAAGHRPCGTCQKSRYSEFKSLWVKSNTNFSSEPVTSIGQIDEYLHKERYASKGTNEFVKESLDQLPEGCFVVRENGPNTAWLYWEGRLHRWGGEGYDTDESGGADEIVGVLTPASIVRMFREGFRPEVTGLPRVY